MAPATKPTAAAHSHHFPTQVKLPSFTELPWSLRWVPSATAKLLGERTFAWAGTWFAFTCGGLTARERKDLSRLFSEAYQQIATNELFSELSSAVPFCLSPNAPQQGHYFSYLPAELNENTPSIVFLHGDGGNMLCYLWALQQEFPDHIILSPSWGMHWPFPEVLPAQQYLADMSNHFEGTYNRKISKPWMFALSGGGPAGFFLTSLSPNSYRGMISIASLPCMDADDLNFPPRYPVLLVNGAQDNRMPIIDAYLAVRDLMALNVNAKIAEIESDHFFILSHRELMGNYIRQFWENLEEK
jgi:pimeloyl-ACP methyl ester carboxylesterase